MLDLFRGTLFRLDLKAEVSYPGNNRSIPCSDQTKHQFPLHDRMGVYLTFQIHYERLGNCNMFAYPKHNFGKICR